MKNAHELMHALGLPHTFYENQFVNNQKHLFSKYKTNNYMDYSRNKKTTFKWQWDILRKSPYVKLLILAFTLLFSSCRVMSSKELQAISCVCNDTITQEDKRLPIPPPERVKNDSLDISISNGWYQKDWCESYLKYIDNLKTKERKIIYYDLNGNIKQVTTFFPNERIGREFIFDDQGNIKEVINHDEGWKICAFQVLAIAKKYAGNNYYKKDPLWQLRKDGYKKKKVWKINYKNRRFNWRTLYIDSDSGRILKVERG